MEERAELVRLLEMAIRECMALRAEVERLRRERNALLYMSVVAAIGGDGDAAVDSVLDDRAKRSGVVSTAVAILTEGGKGARFLDLPSDLGAG